MSDPVLVEVEAHVATVTLNVPARRNAFTPAMVSAFRAAVERLAGERDVRAVVVTGAGKGFSAGADFSTLPTLAAGTGLDGALAVHSAIEELYAAFSGLGELPMPTIAAVNGAAVGGGFGVALLCDIRLVAEEAKVGANFSRLGIHPGLAISERLVAAVGHQAAAELLFTGRLVRGREAAEMGLFRRALPAEEVLPAAMSLASEIAAAAPLSVRWIKRTLRACQGLRLQDTLRTEAMAQALLAQSSDAAEGVQALLQKREPEFKGS